MAKECVGDIIHPFSSVFRVWKLFRLICWLLSLSKYPFTVTLPFASAGEKEIESNKKLFNKVEHEWKKKNLYIRKTSIQIFCEKLKNGWTFWFDVKWNEWKMVKNGKTLHILNVHKIHKNLRKAYLFFFSALPFSSWEIVFFFHFRFCFPFVICTRFAVSIFDADTAK